MNNVSVVLELFFQLENLYKHYYKLITNKSSLFSEETAEEIAEYAKNIKVLFMVIKQEIQKLKSIKKREIELEKLKQHSNKYDQRIIELNKLLINGVHNLKRGTNILKLSSTSKNVVQSNYHPKDLINFTIRVNKSFSSPEGLGTFLPGAFLTPFPQEEVEMKSSFLKFKFDETSRLLPPIISPDIKEVKKGTILEIRYPVTDKDVFFRYTNSTDLIPSYFSGEIYNPTNPLIISKNMTIKVCSCKYGFMDSQIITQAFETTDEEVNDSVISKFGAKFKEGAERPQVDIDLEKKGFEPIRITNFEDESDSHYTPGSMYQISQYRPERNYQTNEDDW